MRSVGALGEDLCAAVSRVDSADDLLADVLMIVLGRDGESAILN